MSIGSALSLRGFARHLGLEPQERRLVFMMGALVALLFGAYTIAKVLRDAMFIGEFGALALPYAYIGVALAAVGFVWIEARITRRYPRGGATRFNQFAAIGFAILAALMLPLEHHWTILAFYVWTGSQAMMILPHFWALALEVWDSRRARTVFPFLGGCGLLGGLLGGGFAAWSAPLLKDDGLIWILVALLVVGFVLTRLVELQRGPRAIAAETTSSTPTLAIIGRSTYLKVFIVALALSVIVSTLIDFQFKVFVQHLYPSKHSLTAFFGWFYLGLNALSLLFQFSVAGWALQRMGLGSATGLQPVTAVLFTALIAISPIGWAVVAMRWVQGIVFQTLGKSSAEIYYTAIHPRERRRIKPAIDTLVERWSDAAVGILLIVLLRTLGVGTTVVAVVTLGLAIAWVLVLVFLNRQYGQAFENILTSRWIEPAADPEAIRTPSARRVLLAALRAEDEPGIVLALRLSHSARDAKIADAVRGCLAHPSPVVRTAAVEAMRAIPVTDVAGAIPPLLKDESESLRRAAVGYLLARGPDATAFARRLLDGDDVALRQYVLDALFERPFDAPDVLTLAWVDARLAAGSRDDLLLAARALGAMPGAGATQRLKGLLLHEDAEIRRAALVSARRRPSRELIGALMPSFLMPEFAVDVRDALAAVGDAAVPTLTALLADGQPPRTQALAARALGRIGSNRAVSALMALVRTSDARLRYLGLQNLNRVRADRGTPVLSRGMVHKLFLRELAEYRANREPARLLAQHPEPAVRLFAASFVEGADMALERALHALGCWYEPKPLAGAFSHLRSGELLTEAPALEYLSHVLPRAVFRPVARIFEQPPPVEESEVAVAAANIDLVAEPIRSAWRWGDAWLRACAVRASRYAPTFDAGWFASQAEDDPMVQAEIAALAPRAGGASC